MTCIAGLVHQGKAYIGGDSAGIGGWDLALRADKKVFRVGPYVIGFTDSFRMGQLLQYSFDPPVAVEPLHRFMATTFVDSVRACLKDGGFAKKESEQESAGSFMVGCFGRLFLIHGDYQVSEPMDFVAGLGCGGQVAVGALWVTRESSMEPYDRLYSALGAAERFSAGVRGPFTIEYEH